MNERLLREIEKRLAGLDEEQRGEVLTAVRDEMARGLRSAEPGLPVEAERERRKEAETLREVLEAIIRQSRLQETIDEVLKQISRVVSFDTGSLALTEPDGGLRIVGGWGFEGFDRVVGLTFRDTLSDGIREQRVALSLADVSQDERFAKIAGTGKIRSWAGIPLLVEGDVVGLISLDRHQVRPFDDDEMHRAKLVAFSAAAAIRKAQLLEQVRGYATAMESVVAVDQAVFAGRPPAEVLHAILEGALKVGTHQGGLLLLEPDARVAAAHGEAFEGSEGRRAPLELLVRTAARFTRDDAGAALVAAGFPPPPAPLYVVPIASADTYVGALVLLDPDGETPDDRLMDSFASRAATAYLHGVRSGPGRS
jgi:putative methionine-R-sulfoxide reductase with GAF domain